MSFTRSSDENIALPEMIQKWSNKSMQILLHGEENTKYQTQ